MHTTPKLTFRKRIRRRNRALICLLIFMFIYMIAIGEMNLGDSRIMNPLADKVSRIIFFGGMIWVISKIRRNNKLLKSERLLKDQLGEELDERNVYLHDKSGGIVWDIMFVILLFVTLTASLTNMPAFHTSFLILVCATALKASVYWWYKRN